MDQPKRDNTYSHILKYTSLFGGVQALNILIGVVRNKFVALILGPDGMGLSALFNSTIKLISDSTTLGLPMTGVREISEALDAGDEKRMEKAIGLLRCWSVLTAILGMVVCVALGPWRSSSTFAWGDHTLHYVLLAPAVALAAITGGETAILKGTRQLRCLATASLYNMLLALLVSVPIYYVWGQSGIVPSIVLLALGQCGITIYYSFRLYRPRFSFSISTLHEGHAMIRLGIAFVLAGVVGSGAEFLVRSYLNVTGELETVGLYNAGFMMTMTYAGMIFSAMETDYFPRLSAAPMLGLGFNRIVNNQVEVSLLLASPALVTFTVALPLLLPLLYSGRFLPVLDMMRWAVLAMYIRALTLPVEYISLARGSSKSYLLLETAYAIVFSAAVILGYRWGGLTGTGIGLLFTGMVNVCLVYGYMHWRFGYAPSADVLRYTLLLLPLGLATCVASFLLTGALYWIVGLVLIMVAFALSANILKGKTNMQNVAILNKISRLFRIPNRGSKD